MKKSLSLLLALTLVFSLFASMASAADATAPTTTAEKYKFFVDAGVLKGTTTGDAQLSSNLDRAQFATIAVALAGLPAATTGSTFKDVTKGQWWFGAIEAAAKADLVNGTGAGKFSPRADVTVESVIKVAVLIAGIKPVADATVAGSSAWAGPYIKAAIDAGLIAADATGFTKAATRGQTIDIAFGAYESLQGPKIVSSKVIDSKNVEVTFSDKEVVKVALTTALENGKETEITVTYKEKEYKTKVTLVVTVLTVTDVKADNLKNIVVSFSKEINDKTATADNIKVYDGTAIVSVTRTVSDDKKSVFLTLGNTNDTNAYAQMKDYKVVINGVEAKDSATDKVTGSEKTVKTQDVAAPTILDVKLNSPKQVEINFSEPVIFPLAAQVLSVVQADGINLYNSVAVDDVALITKNKVNLTLGTALAKGERKIKISGLKDFAGFPIADKEFTITIPDDTTAPVLLSAKANNVSQLEIAFDEPVEASTVNTSNIKVDNNPILNAVAKSDSKTFTVNLQRPLDRGAIVDVIIKYKGVKDHYGNEVKDEKEFKFSVADDTTVPTVAVEAKSDNKLKLTFSKSVNITNPAFELYDKDNKKVNQTISSPAAQTVDGSSDKVYELTFGAPRDLKGNYTLKILGGKVEDKSIRKNLLPETSVAVVFNDIVDPTIVSIELQNESATVDFNGDADRDDQKATIYFSEQMDVATLSATTNYLINGAYPGSNITITPATDGKSVTLFVNNAPTDTKIETGVNLTTANTLPGTPASTKFQILAVKDVAGRILAASQMNQLLYAVAFTDSSVNVADFVSAIELTSKNTIKLTAAANKMIGSIDPNKIHFRNIAGLDLATLGVMGVSIAADGKSATLTLNQELSSDKKFNGVVVELYTNAVGAITLSNGTKLGLVSPQPIADKVGPSFVKAVQEIALNTFTIYFDENVQTGANFIYDLSIVDLDDNNKLLNPATTPTPQFSITVSGNKVTVVIAPGVIGTAGTVDNHRLSVSLNTGRFLTDGATNTAGTFSGKIVQNNAESGEALFDTTP